MSPGTERRPSAISELDRDGHLDLVKGHRRQNFKLAPNWAADLEAHAQLRASSSDPWAFPRIDEPSIGAGFSLHSRYYDELRDSRNHDWLSDVEGEGFFISLDKKRFGTRIFRMLYIAELISKGATQRRAGQVPRQLDRREH